MKGIVGRKIGMTQVFDQETGSLTPVTVIEAGPCPVVAVRTLEADGYEAVQLAFDEVQDWKITKPERGHLEKHDVSPHRRLVEIRGSHELTPGESVTVEVFEPGDRVKVTGTSIGKGFQGTIKRHNFSRGPVSHGSHNVRAPGSIGASATPSRVFKGMKMAGRMGGSKVTQTGLTVVDRDTERNVLLVKGSVPGHKNAVVCRKAGRQSWRGPLVVTPANTRTTCPAANRRMPASSVAPIFQTNMNARGFRAAMWARIYRRDH